MMKKCLSLMLVVSLFGAIEAADSIFHTITDEASARRLNSLIDAYMGGKFVASEKIGILRYPGHDVVANNDQELSYEDTVEKINVELQSVYQQVASLMHHKVSISFKLALDNYDTPQKVIFLTPFTETDKVEIQAFRLYEFLHDIDEDKVTQEVLDQSQQMMESKQFSHNDKWIAANKILAEQRMIAKDVSAHRKALTQAFNAGDAMQVMQAYKKPLHVNPFFTLNAALQKITDDTSADEKNLCRLVVKDFKKIALLNSSIGLLITVLKKASVNGEPFFV